jgi:hypothetical protein
MGDQSFSEEDKRLIEEARKYCVNYAFYSVGVYVGFILIVVWFILFLVVPLLVPAIEMDLRTIGEGVFILTAWCEVWRNMKQKERMARFIITNRDN